MDKTQLPADVLGKIKAEANKIYWETHKVSTERDPYCMGLTMFEVAQVPMINALTEYATRLLQVEQENKELKQWKSEATELLNPILDYGQSKEAGIPLGKIITNTVLERCKQATELQAKCDRYEGALKGVQKRCKEAGLKQVAIDDAKGMAIYHSLHLANEALCGEGEKEEVPNNDMALYETRLAVRMLLKVFKSVEKSPEQEKFYQQADYIFKKHHSITDVLRDNQKEDQ
jgi:hypothetical protein